MKNVDVVVDVEGCFAWRYSSLRLVLYAVQSYSQDAHISERYLSQRLSS